MNHTFNLTDFPTMSPMDNPMDSNDSATNLPAAVVTGMFAFGGVVLGSICFPMIYNCCRGSRDTARENREAENELITRGIEFGHRLDSTNKRFDQLQKEERKERHAIDSLTGLPQTTEEKLNQRYEQFDLEKQALTELMKEAPEKSELLPKNTIGSNWAKWRGRPEPLFPTKEFNEKWKQVNNSLKKAKTIAKDHAAEDFESTTIVRRSAKQGYVQNTDIEQNIQTMHGRLQESRKAYAIMAKKRHDPEEKKKLEIVSDDVNFYKANVMEALDTHLLLLTDNNKFRQAQTLLFDVFDPNDAQNAALTVAELPDCLLNRLANHALRCQANNQNFPFNKDTMQPIQNYNQGQDQDKKRFDDNEAFAETMLKKAITKNYEILSSNPADLATSYTLLSVLKSRRAEVATRTQDGAKEKQALIDAYSYAEEAVKHAPDQPLCQLRKGRALHAMGRDTQALACVNKALELATDYPMARIIKAKILSNDDKKRLEAREEIDKLPDLLMAPSVTDKNDLTGDKFRGSYVFAQVIHSTIADVLEKSSKKAFTDKEDAKQHRAFAELFDQNNGITKASGGKGAVISR